MDNEFGIAIWKATAEPGEPICIVDAGGKATIFDEHMTARSIEIYLTDTGYIKGVRVMRHTFKGDTVEAEVGDVMPLIQELEDEDAS